MRTGLLDGMVITMQSFWSQLIYKLKKVDVLLMV